MSDPLARLAQASAVGWILMLLSGCAYQGLSIEQHYSTYAAQLPDNNKIFVCSAYGCRTRSEFKFAPGDIAKLRSLMAEPKRGADPRKERVRLGHTLAWMEKRVGDVVGTSADRPGDDFQGAGDPTQMDCVDVATNLTSYLLVLESSGLIKHHGRVRIRQGRYPERPFWMDALCRHPRNGPALDLSLGTSAPPRIVRLRSGGRIQRLS